MATSTQHHLEPLDPFWPPFDPTLRNQPHLHKPRQPPQTTDCGTCTIQSSFARMSISNSQNRNSAPTVIPPSYYVPVYIPSDYQSSSFYSTPSSSPPLHPPTLPTIPPPKYLNTPPVSPPRINYSKKPLSSKTDDSEPVILTRSHVNPDTVSESYTLATLFRNKIFVGSLNQTITAGDLVDFFQKFGVVTEAKVVMDDKGSSRGYGFVSFADSKSVKKILSAGSIFICGQRVAVASAIRKKHPEDI
ncbi:ras GTPase-activating protein-binding protein 1-like [Clytia hemisphaerica]|uniref:RRM domain-containing protein n=1 Tax=Clytia hemisphaerica TaxID=252671 RepID=A0A7M6DPU2_9CNID